MNFFARAGPALAEISKWIDEGKVKVDNAAVEKVSIENVPDVYAKLFGNDKPPGKLITELSE